MKKTLSLLVILTLLLSLAACGGNGASSSDPAIGSYEFKEAIVEGQSVTADTFAEMGFDFSASLEIKADGKFTLTFDAEGLFDEDDSGDGTWEKKGDVYTLTMDGDAQEATYNASAKTFSFETDDDTSMVFVKK